MWHSLRVMCVAGAVWTAVTVLVAICRLFGVSNTPVSDATGQLAPFCDATGKWLPLLCIQNCGGVADEVICR